jgi:hypothetical protein
VSSSEEEGLTRREVVERESLERERLLIVW